MTWRDGVRIAVGALIALHGVRRILLMPQALGDAFLRHPGKVTVVAWWPHLPMWMASVLTVLPWAATAALVAGGIGLVAFHRPTMRLCLVALAVLVALEVLFAWPSFVAFAVGWISLGPEWYARYAPAEVLSDPRFPYYARMGVWIGLAFSFMGVLLQVAAMVYVRRLLARGQAHRTDDTAA